MEIKIFKKESYESVYPYIRAIELCGGSVNYLAEVKNDDGRVFYVSYSDDKIYILERKGEYLHPFLVENSDNINCYETEDYQIVIDSETNSVVRNNLLNHNMEILVYFPHDKKIPQDYIVYSQTCDELAKSIDMRYLVTDSNQNINQALYHASFHLPEAIIEYNNNLFLNLIPYTKTKRLILCDDDIYANKTIRINNVDYVLGGRKVLSSDIKKKLIEEGFNTKIPQELGGYITGGNLELNNLQNITSEYRKILLKRY